MTTRNREAFVANTLYVIATYGLVIVPTLFTLAFTFLTMFTGGPTQLMDPYSPSYALMMIVSEFFPLMLPGIIALAMKKNRPMARGLRLGFKPSSLLAIPAAVVGYFFVIGIVTVWSGFLQLFGIGESLSVALPTGSRQLISSLFIIALVPALCEEFLFRGLLLPAYEKYFKNPWSAVLLSGLVFGLMHGQPTGAPGHIFLGAVLGFVVVATDSIWAGVLYHLTNNTMAMLLSYFSTQLADLPFFEAEAAAMDPFTTMLGGAFWAVLGGALFAGFLGIFVLVYRKRHAARQAEPADPALDLGDPRRNRRLLWLPVWLSLPMIAFNYGANLLLPFFLRLLGG